jgi:hypothetical protein
VTPEIGGRYHRGHDEPATALDGRLEELHDVQRFDFA